MAYRVHVIDKVVLEPRHVKLTPRSTTVVRRTLPHRDIRMIGPWCFVDHFGPELTSKEPMRVAPHPHTGLQTVTWLVEGLIEHRDSVGSVQRITPGALNLMTAGRGISHSELSIDAEAPRMHGIQLWVALPEQHRNQAPHFEHHEDLPVVVLDGAHVRVLAGGLAGTFAPTSVYSPLVGAEIWMDSADSVTLPVDPHFEHGVLVVDGQAVIDGEEVPFGSLIYVAPGRANIHIISDGPLRAMLIGGEPFTENIVMWWNFIGRSHDEVEQMRNEWQREDSRFGSFSGYPGERIPAPEMPRVTLTPRGRMRDANPLLDEPNAFS